MVKNNLIFDIPNSPVVPLDNFLLNLVGERDGVGNSLYLHNIEYFVHETWERIIKKNKKIGVRKVIPKELRMEPTHLYAIIKGKRGISIQSMFDLFRMWKEYCNVDDNEINAKWDNIYFSNFLIASFSKSEKISLPKNIFPELSYLIGWLVGDGCFDDHNNHYRVKITEKNEEQLKWVLKPIIERIFGVRCLIRKDNPSPCVKINSKPVFRYLHKVLGVRVGKIPEIIKNIDIVNKRFFLRGVFDAEGDVDQNYLRSKIRISQASVEFLEFLIGVLREIGIGVNGPYSQKTSNCHHIEIRKKSEILKFIEMIGSSHFKKRKRFDILEKEIRSKYTFI